MKKVHSRVKYVFVFIFLGAALSCCSVSSTAQEAHDFSAMREQMVEQQLKARGIKDESVIASMSEVERQLFVPRELAGQAYEDTSLPIGYGQTISQPYIVAYMVEEAGLGPEDRVLEIGTGSGYQAAVLSGIVKEVYSVELVKPLADSSAKKLKDLGFDNVSVKNGDGYKGWPEESPFDAIIVTAAPDRLPEELVMQLKPGGCMIVPIGIYSQKLYKVRRTENGFDKKELLPVRFVPMVHPPPAQEK